MWKCLHDDPGTSKLLKQIYGASRPDIAYPKVSFVDLPGDEHTCTGAQALHMCRRRETYT